MDNFLKQIIMKVDFSKLKVQTTIEGEPSFIDVRKELGNAIYQNTGDIGLYEKAKEIYFSEGCVEINAQESVMIIDIVKKCFIIPIQIAISEILK